MTFAHALLVSPLVVDNTTEPDVGGGSANDQTDGWVYFGEDIPDSYSWQPFDQSAVSFGWEHTGSTYPNNPGELNLFLLGAGSPYTIELVVTFGDGSTQTFNPDPALFDEYLGSTANPVTTVLATILTADGETIPPPLLIHRPDAP